MRMIRDHFQVAQELELTPEQVETGEPIALR